jgi:16S rRNA (cytosine967-C5)-methyltransferase
LHNFVNINIVQKYLTPINAAGSAENYITLLANAWSDVVRGGQFADKALERLFRENKIADEEKRGLIATIFYDMLRNARLLQAISGSEEFGKLFVALQKLPNAVIANPFMQNFKRAIRLSVPDWLDELGESELGENWESIANALLWRPQPVIRVNLRHCLRAELARKLSRRGFAPFVLEHNICGIAVNSTGGLFSTEEFRSGLYEMQDAASQEVALFCNVKPGMRVIDGCAGAGGKSLHLADLMLNRGKIIALDIRENALVQLQKRAARARIDIIETRHIATTKVVKRLAGSADIVLLDVPCSGSGVFRRNPDAKWRLIPDDLTNLRQKQSEILEKYSKMAAINGRIVYSVCSIFPSEGENQVLNFLNRNKGQFCLEDERRISPVTGADGFYMARIKRTK